MAKEIGRSILLFSVILLFSPACGILPRTVDGLANSVRSDPTFTTSEEAQKLHKDLFIGDLHADSLLFSRDLSQRSHYAHVDIPRLIEGNVALQAFTVVTKFPVLPRTEDGIDTISLIAWFSPKWPSATHRSLKARALHQANELHRFEELWNDRPQRFLNN